VTRLPKHLKDDNKYKGNLAVASAITHFIATGYTINIPLADTAKYDLVIERDGVFQAVQCKYSGYEKSPGIYAVPLYVSGGNRSAGNRRIKYQKKDFDILFVQCASGRKYAIPFAEIVGQSTINVGRDSKWSKWEEYLLDTSENCRPVEEFTGQSSSNSMKPVGDGNVEPSL
jgi:PD-(D/E)XK endonuclease